MGLFGLAIFTGERRMKEVGIRKVLGSSVGNIIYLLSRDFTFLVFIAIVIALPVSYLLVSDWLTRFAFRIDLTFWQFAGSGLLAILIAWLTISIQAFKSARVNPVSCLRDE
jgi:ABC-type antimicrobial peptide transport system permease subunit